MSEPSSKLPPADLPQLPSAGDSAHGLPSQGSVPPPNGGATTADGKAPRDRTSPPQRRGKLTCWLTLAGCLGLAALPLFVYLNQADVVDRSEARSVAMSAQTWKHLRSDGSSQGLTLKPPPVPLYNAKPQTAVAPATTWLHLIAFTADPAEKLTVERMVFDARLVSAVFALLTIGAVYWAGFSIGGIMPAGFAALVCLANPVFVYYGRLGDDTMPGIGFAMLALAGALWAIRPLRPPALLLRQGLGWTISGLALGMAVLVSGPVALSLIILPVLVIMLLCPHRISHLLGLTASLFIAALLITPWVGFVQGQNIEAWKVWIGDVLPRDIGQLAVYGELAGARFLLLIATLLPWTLWLVGGWVQPFSTSSTGSRLRMFIGWLWFLCVLIVLLVIPGKGNVKAILPALPVAAILIGQLFGQYSELSAEGRHVRFWRILRWPHLALLLVVSIVVPPILYGKPFLVQSAYDARELAAPMHWSYWAGLGVMLVLLTLLSLRWAMRQYPGRALVTWAIWTVLGITTLIGPMVRGPRFYNPVKASGQVLNQHAAAMPIYYLNPSATQDDAAASALDPAFLLYADLAVPDIRSDQLDQAVEEWQAFLLLSASTQTDLPGFEMIRNFPEQGLILWKSQTTQPDIVTMPDQTAADSAAPLKPQAPSPHQAHE